MLVAGVHVLACLAFLDYVCRSFGISQRLLLIHAPLVVAALFAALIAGAALARLTQQWRGAPYLGALFPAIVITALFGLDIASFATNRWLAISLTRSLVKLWAQAWWKGEQLLPVSSGVLFGALIVVVTTVMVEMMIWAKTLRGFRLSLPRSPAAVAIVVVVTCGYMVFFEQLAVRASRSELIAADPIVAFAGANWTGVDARQQAIFDRFRQQEPRRRASYGRHIAFDKKNVVIITIDSLRADHLPLYGYERPTTPFLSELQRDGKLRRVEFATSTCAESNCGILSTLFSKTLRHQVAEDFSLFALLKEQGYDSHFVLSGNHDWMGQRQMYGDELTSYFDGRDSTRYGWSDDRVLLEGLERIDDYARPSFFYFHLMSPHILGHKDARYRIYQPAVVTLDMRALFSGEYDHTSIVNSYDNGIVEADATIHDLFSALDRKGYLKNSLVVILADHGEALGERAANMYGHVNWLYQETIRIPMLIYDDSATTYQGLAFGTQVDVAPTVVDRLGLPMPPGWEGVSLLRAPAPRQTMHQTKLTKPCFAIIDNASDRMLKYMQCRGGAHEELYDLSRDASEQHDLAQTEPALLAGYRQVLDRWRNW